MKKKILILSGGISKERLISLDTGFQVAKELKKNGYKIKISEPDNNLEKNIYVNGKNSLNSIHCHEVHSKHLLINLLDLFLHLTCQLARDEGG